MFKPGDKVRCVENNGIKSLNVGEIYIVDEAAQGLLFFKGQYYGSLPSRFELVSSGEDPTGSQSPGQPFLDISKLGKKECIHCTTKEQAEYICRLFFDAGLVRKDGSSYGDKTHPGYWNERDTSKTYFSDGTRNNGDAKYNSRQDKGGYTILPATDFGAPIVSDNLKHIETKHDGYSCRTPIEKAIKLLELTENQYDEFHLGKAEISNNNYIKPFNLLDHI